MAAKEVAKEVVKPICTGKLGGALLLFVIVRIEESRVPFPRWVNRVVEKSPARAVV